MILDVTKAPYFAKGDGKTDDTNAIQRALIDAVGGLDASGQPKNAARVLPVDGAPNGARVHLPAGESLAKPFRTYVVTKPLATWGMTDVFGDGPMTMIDGSAIAQDRGVFELDHAQIGPNSWWNSGCKFHDMAIKSNGHGLRTTGRGGTTGALNAEWYNMQFVGRGFMVYLANLYSQACYIHDCNQFSPGSGCIAIWGNLNTVARCAICRGARADFRSPWLDGLGIIDVRGEGNRVIDNNVEFSLPTPAPGQIDPQMRVIPFNFKSHDPGDPANLSPNFVQDIIVSGNWPEFQQPGALVDGLTTIFDHMQPTGVWWKMGKCRYIQSGSIKIPSLDVNWGILSQYVDAQGDTFVEVDRYRSMWGADFPPNTTINHAFIQNAYGGKWYDPNPSGDDLEWDWEPWIDDGSEGTVEQTSPTSFKVTVTKVGRADGRICVAAKLKPKVQQPWVLYSANHQNTSFIQWWTTTAQQYGQDAISRTQNNRCSCPLPDWMPGAGLLLGMNVQGVAEFSNIRVTPLAL